MILEENHQWTCMIQRLEAQRKCSALRLLQSVTPPDRKQDLKLDAKEIVKEWHVSLKVAVLVKTTKSFK